MKRRLTDRQRAFIIAVNRGRSQTAAARLAGYSCPPESGYRLMQHPKIKAKLQPVRIDLQQAMRLMRQAYGPKPKPKKVHGGVSSDARQEMDRLQRELTKLIGRTK
jgi:phage terminase small subunit